MSKLFRLFLALILTLTLPADVLAKKAPPQIIFVPHDSRPISSDQSAQILREIGYDVLMPPKEILGGRTNLGEPEKVWAWLEETANKQKPVAAVLSLDTLIYGSLVGSRKHDCDLSLLLSRAERAAAFKKAHRRLPLYAFGSIMRTPRTGESSGTEEPGYYRNYGADIFRYTALTDKSEIKGLTGREKKEIKFLKRLIPKKSLDDWLNRRNKNFAVSQRLIDLARTDTFAYLALGRDDNAPYSQTHMESRKLSEYGADLGISKFQAMAGIDEFAMLMLARAVNNHRQEIPFVYVRYNWGRGEKTVPKYSDETLENTMRDHIVAVGAYPVKSAQKADLALYVNTNPNGATLEGDHRTNQTKMREGTKFFADLVNEAIYQGQPTAVADVAYANGADNALMEKLADYGLLFRLKAYAGWNTATNSCGFALAQGVLTKFATDQSLDRLLLMRYLDDWAYQSNVRPTIGRQLGWLRGSGAYQNLDDKMEAVKNRTARLLKQFADRNLPPFPELEDLAVEFPWNRMFEAEFKFEKRKTFHDMVIQESGK